MSGVEGQSAEAETGWSRAGAMWRGARGPPEQGLPSQGFAQSLGPGSGHHRHQRPRCGAESQPWRRQRSGLFASLVDSPPGDAWCLPFLPLSCSPLPPLSKHILSLQGVQSEPFRKTRSLPEMIAWGALPEEKACVSGSGDALAEGRRVKLKLTAAPRRRKRS